MCDGLGRQFSYTCPNTTLFQQRMLICDHWYMVNCSKSESDYSANLLIGQCQYHFHDIFYFIIIIIIIGQSDIPLENIVFSNCTSLSTIFSHFYSVLTSEHVQIIAYQLIILDCVHFFSHLVFNKLNSKSNLDAILKYALIVDDIISALSTFNCF